MVEIGFYSHSRRMESVRGNFRDKVEGLRACSKDIYTSSVRSRSPAVFAEDPIHHIVESVNIINGKLEMKKRLAQLSSVFSVQSPWCDR